MTPYTILCQRCLRKPDDCTCNTPYNAQDEIAELKSMMRHMLKTGKFLSIMGVPCVWCGRNPEDGCAEDCVGKRAEELCGEKP